MGYITVDNENSTTVDLYYEDHGSGQPIVLIHGYPLNGASWEKQLPVLLEAGYRVITYDRRGFGESSKPSFGYDYDTFARDLDKLMTTLDLRDAILVGFSMGTGEVTRYLGNYGSERVSKAVLAAPIPPYLLKTDDNPTGVDSSVFEGIKASIRADRYAHATNFLHEFFNQDVFLGTQRLSEEAVRANWNVAVGSSSVGFLACVDAWLTDFRGDIGALNVPLLIIQGDADRILPLPATGAVLHTLLPDASYVVIPDGPHAIGWTHAEEFNTALIEFLKA
jgi:non-heme chloroperoxidase